MPTQNKTIAYFSMEIALKSEIPNYAGGLGVLAADILKSCADLGEQVIGVSLMYHVSEDPEYAFKPGKDFRKLDQTVHMHIEDRDVVIGAWEYVIKGKKGDVPIYFLDTNFSDNKRWDRDITKDLYSLDRYTRLCQESILGIGGVRMLRELGYKDIGTFHLNEGHAALLTLALLHEADFKDEDVRKKCVFTTHTPVPAGHDRFSYDMVNNVLTQKVPWHIKKIAGESDLNMTLLALNLSRKSNAVSRRHGQVCQQMFPGYPFESITNGVHAESWVAPSMAELFDRRLPGWREDPKKFSGAIDIPDEELWSAHQQGKKALLEMVNGNPEILSIPAKEIEPSDYLDENRLTVVFARRIVPYKRPLLLFHDIERLRGIAYGKLQVIFAGPYHAGDHFAINTINEIVHYGKALRGQVRIAIMPDYKLGIAHSLVQGTDVWLNNPQIPMEASGTSGMKAALNGGLNLSIQDGWWIEGYEKEPKSGWAFGHPATEICQPSHDHIDADALYNDLKDVIDCYSNRRKEWLERMKHAIALGAYFNTHRCVEEYKEKMWNA